MIVNFVGDKIRIVEYDENEVIAASLVKSAMQGELPWVEIISGRNIVFHDSFGTRLEYSLGSYDGDHGRWEATHVR